MQPSPLPRKALSRKRVTFSPMSTGRSITRPKQQSTAPTSSIPDHSMALITYREALRTALDEEIRLEKIGGVMGEEVAQYKGAYKVSEGLWAPRGEPRLVDSRFSEA